MIEDTIQSTPITALPTWPHFSEEEIQAASATLRSGKVNYWTGEECRLFEQEYAKSVGTQYAIALMNGTVALEAALYALDIGPQDEVITTCRTFIASASSAVMRGATPVLVDIDLTSQNITPDAIARAITPRTKAIIAVHLAGWPCEMDAIMTLAKEKGLYVIEDCAQAHGASFKGRQVGAWGDIAAFSFCQDKIITTGGEGGMITTNNPTWWDKIWSFKDHGKSYDAVYHRHHPAGYRWLHESFGTNWRMTEMQGAIGRIQLRKLPEWKKKRAHHAAILTERFARIPALRVCTPPDYIEHAFYKYYVFVRPQLLKSDWTRDRLLDALVAAGIPCQVGSCSEIYQEKAFTALNLRQAERLPNAKQLGETSLMFQVHPTLSEEQMRLIANTAGAIIEKASADSN